MNLEAFRTLFARFLRARSITRHFRRHAVLESLAGTAVSRQMPPELSRDLMAAASAEPQALLEKFGSHPEGLTKTQVRRARSLAGPNEIEHERPLAWWQHLWLAFKNPFNLLLTVLASVSWLTEDMKATIVIVSMVALATGIRFVQETRSHKAADRLKALVSNKASVLRRDDNGETADTSPGAAPGQKPAHVVELPMNHLVPGDIVALAAGDMIPADCRILWSKDLHVSQAAMTGEALPAEKHARQGDAKASTPLDLANILFMGTNVVSGSAHALVVATGRRTFFGELASRVTLEDRTPTQFQSGVNRVSFLLVRFMAVMVPLVFLINGFTKEDWMEAFLFALSVAVGLTPEMLPMIVTSTLAKGAVLLSRKKVVVKRLDAIQNFGAMDVLCTDKTGTLTQDRILLERHIDAWGAESESVLQHAYLNSYYQTGLKNLLDVAVLEKARIHRDLEVASAFRKVDEIPFDFQRRRMSVVVSERGERHRLITKGAVEEVLAACSCVRHGAVDEPLTHEVLERLHAVSAALNEDGLRVVAVAAKEMPPEKEIYRVEDEAGLTLLGYVAFLDPPKESAAPALEALAAHGVQVKVLTGDNDLVTRKICHQVGLEVRGLLLGSDIDRMGEEELTGAVETNNVFAKLTPAHKERIVRRLRGAGHVVGFIGDGINDAPALRAADIGISVDSAVDIAKEAADIILLEKSLLVLDQGVIEGRKTFANMLKYIKMTASSNFGNVLSVLVASAFIPFLPMLPLQLLVQNLLYDLSQVAIPFDNVDEELLLRPQKWDPADIGRFMVWFGPVSSLFDLATYGVMWFVFSADSIDRQALFQSGWFVEGLLTQTLIVHMIRTRRIPFLESRPSGALLAATGAIMAAGVFLPMGPLAPFFRLQPLPAAYFPILAAILAGYAILTQLAKGLYARRYGWR
jgi:Mg2+-importing ATPase